MNFSRNKYLSKLIGHRHNHLIKVITGMRRSGKVTMGLKQFLLDE